MKPAFRALDLVRWQGLSRFESGAYTIVREHFESDFNTALGQKIMVLKPVLAVGFADAQLIHRYNPFADIGGSLHHGVRRCIPEITRHGIFG